MAISTPVQDRTVTLNGLRFHYLDWGNQGAQPLVLLHGLSSHAHSWDRFATAMRQDFHILALDQRGHGESDWADDYSPDRRAEDVDAFVRELGLEQIALVGLSMGGRAAFNYTALYPGTVERLVIVDIGPEAPASGMARIQRGLAQQDVFDDPEEAFRQARAANPRPSDEDLRHRISHGLMQRPDGRWTFRFDPALRSRDNPITRQDPAVGWSRLPTITCPTLLIRGEASDVLSVETAERMVREMPNCTLVTVKDSGHSVPLDNPAGFLEAARPFLLKRS
jgi:pimeloyl-ACP methyl ester carboxylesterase